MRGGDGGRPHNSGEVRLTPIPTPPSARQIAVIGSSRCAEDSESWQLAEEVGSLLAQAGVTVVCGGGPGVMEAVARGPAAPTAP